MSLITALGFTNGSLYEQIQASSQWVEEDNYPLRDVDPDINLTVYPSQVLQLNFGLGHGDMPYSFNLIAMLLHPNATRVKIECVYPLSGQYDVLPRMLFYAMLVVAVLFRRCTWVASAAVGTVMTYSSVAALHFFVMLPFFDWGHLEQEGSGRLDIQSVTAAGDIDFWGIAPVLATAGVMLTPMMAWSATFRSNKAKAVMVYWALLVFAALIPVLKLMLGWQRGKWYVPQLASISYCTGSGPECSFNNLADNQYWELYNQCQCVDFCGLLSPYAPLRRGTNMIPFLYRKSSWNIICRQSCNDKKLNRLIGYIVALWTFAIVQGLLAVLHSQSTQEQVRNRIFRILSADSHSVISYFFKGERERKIIERFHLEQYPRKDSFYWRGRFLVAKTVAATYVVLTLLGVILYPAVFILTVVAIEILLGSLPASEQSDAIGAWGPWTAAAFIVLSSAIARYHSTWVQRLSSEFDSLSNLLCYSKEDRPVRPVLERASFSQRISLLLRDMCVHLWHKIGLKVWKAKTGFGQFREWWGDPDTSSNKSVSQHIQLKQLAESNDQIER